MAGRVLGPPKDARNCLKIGSLPPVLIDSEPGLWEVGCPLA
jgi:hypothetical protein